MIDIPTSPLWTLANVPTPTTTPREADLAAQSARRHARTPDEADLFLHQLGLDTREVAA